MADSASTMEAPSVPGGSQPDGIPVTEGENTESAEDKKLAKKRRFFNLKKLEPEVKAKRLKERAVAALGGEVAAAMFLHELRPNLEFKVVGMTGPTHSPIFTMHVEVDGQVYEGQGITKKKAKASAAEKALQVLMAGMDLGEDVDVSSLQARAEARAAETPLDAATAVALGKSPVMILSYIRPQLVYDIVSEPQVAPPAPPPPTHDLAYKMAVTVDSVRFEAEGSSKKMAKAKACQAALESLFGLQCVPGRGGVPVYTGDDANWSSLRVVVPHVSTATPASIEASVLGFPLPGNKHPLMFIHELYPDVEFKVQDGITAADGTVQAPPPGPAGSYTCTVRIEDFDFFGEGTTKKVAKLNAAVAALTAINSAGILTQRVSERESRRAATPKWKPAKRAMFEQNDGSIAEAGSEGATVSEGEGKKKAGGGPPLPKNAAMKLNELQRGAAVYADVSHTLQHDDRGAPVNTFIISVEVNGQYFQGSGTNKRLAKMAAAEGALRGIGQWTEEDEKVKAVQAAADAEAAAKSAEKARLNSVRSSNFGGGGFGRGSSRGGRGRGGRGRMDLRGPAAWVPGGVLHGNDAPLLVGGNSGYGSGSAADYSGSAATFSSESFVSTSAGVDQSLGGMGAGYGQQGGVQGTGFGPYGERWGGAGTAASGGGFQGQSTTYQQF